MSRSGYSDDCENLGLWRGAVAKAINGKRGQAFLKEALAALDAMPVKELVSNELEAEGQFCTLGVVGRARKLDLSKIDTYDYGQLSGTFNIAQCLAQEIMYINDESVGEFEWVYSEFGPHTRQRINNASKKRWQAVRDWLEANINFDGMKE